MSKLIQIPNSNIRRYVGSQAIFNILVSFLNDYFPNHWLLAGGAARYMLSPENIVAPADDIDIFLLNSCIAQGAFRDELTEKLYEIGIIRKKSKYKWLDDLTFQGQSNLYYQLTTLICRPFMPNIQFIGVYYNDPENPFTNYTNRPNDEDILNSFDFTVCQAAISPHTTETSDKIICKVSETFMEDEKNRTLQLTGAPGPALMQRIYKYVKMGYSLSEESYIDLINYIAATKDPHERNLGHRFLTKKRNSKDFILAPYAQELYKKWLESMKF